jgi:hypothetical protein
VLLVSAKFFASEYVWRKELPKILENANDKGATILCLPVSSCLYDGTGIEKYQFVTNPKTPLKLLSEGEREVEYTKLAKRIKDIYEQGIIE